MAQVVVVTNRKGGVGKSTMTAHLSSGLAAKGYRVGIIDSDSQGHAAVMLRMPEENGLYGAMIEKKSLDQVVQVVPKDHYTPPDNLAQGELFLIPSSSMTYRIPYQLEDDETFLFVELAERFTQEYALDALFIDTSPTLSLFDGAIALAADWYLYVTECERLAFDGVLKAIRQMSKFAKQRRQYMNRNSEIMGIIPNKFRANTRLHRNNIRNLSEYLVQNQYPADMVWSPIRMTTTWAEAMNEGTTLYNYAPSSGEVHEAWAAVERVERRMQLQAVGV